MLLAIFPHAVIDVTICEDVDSEAILFVIRVSTFVATAVGPYVRSLAMHLTIAPLALVDGLARGNAHLTMPVELVVLEITFVHAAISSGLYASRTLLAFLIHAIIPPAVRADLHAFAMRYIKEELSLIAQLDLARTVLPGHFALATCLTKHEVALDDGPSGFDCLGALTL